MNKPVEPVLLRFYLIERTYTQEVLQAEESVPAPRSLGLTCIITPDEGYYFCSPQRMARYIPVEIDCDWPAEVVEQSDFDALDMYWQDGFLNHGGLYEDYSRLVASAAPNQEPVWAKDIKLIKFIGEFYTYDAALKHYEDELR